MDRKPFYYEFDDFIKIRFSIKRKENRLKDKNVCIIKKCKIIDEGEKNK